MCSECMRIVLHVDFDYFYAQVEEVLHQEYRQKPIVVCMYSGRTDESGAVASCNYLARSYGVRAAMPIVQAKKLLMQANAVFVPAHRELYEQKSFDAMKLLEKYADAFEVASIDEAFLDVSKQVTGFGGTKSLGLTIKDAIKKEINLTCSIGIAPNKLVAKIASDFHKPDGLTIVPPEDVASFLAPLAVDRIPGVGPKGKVALNTHGIVTIADLRQADRGTLLELFGKKTATFFIHAARGEDDQEVKQVAEQKQLSRIVTLKQDAHTLNEFKMEINYLIDELVNELTTRSLVCKSVGIIAIDMSMNPLTRSRALLHPTNSTDEIKRVVYELFESLLYEPRTLRRVGVKVERLQSVEGQKRLWEF